MKAGIRGILILIEQSWLSFMEREKGRVSSSKYLIKYILSLTKLYSTCDFVWFFLANRDAHIFTQTDINLCIYYIFLKNIMCSIFIALSFLLKFRPWEYNLP